MTRWDLRFIEMAALVASWSKDQSTKVGAVITNDKNHVISLGFNGFPRGVEDRLDVSRETKLARTIHAEPNAILHAKQDLAGCSIYVTRPPCSNCAALIIQSGISRVVYEAPDPDFLVRWKDSISESIQMFEEARITVVSLEP